ncbi:MAG: 4Fe-4S binding protein [Treponema sp.]|jgi:ferredoxin|nr:4Fe-4S binding protein [Treponema sp.]
MVRQKIKIDEDKCNGCGLCTQACHEAAITISGGKARLIKDDYCDGLGNCLPVCPVGAITFEQREAAMFDEFAVKANLSSVKPSGDEQPPSRVCPGSMAHSIDSRQAEKQTDIDSAVPENAAMSVLNELFMSKLQQWPVQIRLVPVNARYFEDADLLVSADCCAYAYGGFHRQFMKNRITIIGCPKLDDVDYTGKLTEIFSGNAIKSVTVAKMEVPCCAGIEYASVYAIKASGKKIPLQVFIITTEGKVICE